MTPIVYRDRLSGRREIEKVYGEGALRLLYGDGLISRLLGTPLVHGLSRSPLFSSLFGRWQKSPLSRNTAPFIDRYAIDASEFRESVASFASFNDFFIRQLKQEARPIAQDDAIIPAYGRFLFYPNSERANGFIVKGESLSWQPS